LPARILIDYLAVRTALREFLDWHSFQVCGDAKDGKEAIEKVMNGFKAAQEILRISPATKIVFLKMHDEPSMVQGTRSWAHGFVPKSAAGTALIPILHRLAGTTPKVRTAAG